MTIGLRIRNWWRVLWHYHWPENEGPVVRVYDRGVPSVRQWKFCRGCGERTHLTLPVVNPRDPSHGDAFKSTHP